MDLFYPTSLQQSCASTELFEALRCSKVLSDIKHVYLITFNHLLQFKFVKITSIWKKNLF